MPTALAALQLRALALFEARFRHRALTRLAGAVDHVLTATLLSARLKIKEDGASMVGVG